MKPLKRLVASIAAAASVTFLFSGPCLAASSHEAWPEKPIKFIVPFGAGGGADIEGRVLAKQMASVLGVTMVPIDMPGAGGARAYTHVKNAKPNGYTVVWTSTSLLTTTNMGNVPFNYQALDNIGRVEFQPLPFAVNTNSQWKTFQQFVNSCHKHPMKYKVSYSSKGSSTHVAVLALMSAAKCKVVQLPVGSNAATRPCFPGKRMQWTLL